MVSRFEILFGVKGKIAKDNSTRKFDIKSAFWDMWAKSQDDRIGKHEIYWGHHSCDLLKEHDGNCICRCGVSPHRFSMFWGEDFSGYRSEDDKQWRITCQGILDRMVNDNFRGEVGRYYKQSRSKYVDNPPE